MNKNQIKLKFLGVRGSYNSANPDTNRYGGNTSCVQIETASDIFFIDAGSGLTKVDDPTDTRQMHLLFTHYHWDHVLGLPFFSNLYTHKKPLMVKGMKPEYYSLEEVLKIIFNPPFCPISWAAVEKRMVYEEIPKTGEFRIGDVQVNHIPIMHPGGSLGYKFTFKGNTITILTDIELSKAFDSYEQDWLIIEDFIRDSDILIMDAAMTDDEYYGKEGSEKVGWGHSTMDECINISKKANVKATYITHYLPYRTDHINDEIYKDLLKTYDNIYFAVEGETITLEAK